MSSISGSNPINIPQNQPSAPTGQVGKTGNADLKEALCNCQPGTSSLPPREGNFTSLAHTPAQQTQSFARADAGGSINNNPETTTFDQAVDTGLKILDGALSLASFVAMAV